MTPFEIVTAILNLLALILIPIIAVIIGQHLQNVSAKRKDKMDVFKTMMMNRIGWSVEGTRAMNIIDIVFSDDKNVRQAWSEYYHALCVKDPDEIQLKQMQQAQDLCLQPGGFLLQGNLYSYGNHAVPVACPRWSGTRRNLNR